MNEITLVADPFGFHQDTFNGRKSTGFENKVVFSYKVERTSLDRERVPGKARGGVLFFPEFGFCTVCQPNFDIEYHALGLTLHGTSEPKYFRQGRGGGRRDDLCFTLCDHPNKQGR